MAEHTGPSFYDDENVYATYLQRRERADAPNDTLEKPVILELLGDVVGQRVLDLGCGDAAIGAVLLRRGALSYLGVEGSHRMAALAQQTHAATGGEIVTQPLEQWMASPASADLVLARLSLHYVADLAPVFANVARALVPSGRFVFSVEHPVITSCDRGWPAGTPRRDWIVDDYFSTGVRLTTWMGGTVQKYHRTVEQYVRLLHDAGLIITDLREAQPQREHFPDQASYERRKRIPLFLILAARKPA